MRTAQFLSTRMEGGSVCAGLEDLVQDDRERVWATGDPAGARGTASRHDEEVAWGMVSPG
jgi:hypothetical protein